MRFAIKDIYFVLYRSPDPYVKKETLGLPVYPTKK